MNISILIIDDDGPRLSNDPVVWELQDKYGADAVRIFEKPNEALDHIITNIGSNFIVLLDIDFPTEPMNGHQILEGIRRHSELIPVILWSGIDETGEKFSDLINNRAFGFLSKASTSEQILALVEKARTFYESSLDNAIEDWIENRPEDKDKPVFFSSDGQAYSLNQILEEIRMQTEVGRLFSRRLNELSIDLLLRNKRKIDG